MADTINAIPPGPNRRNIFQELDKEIFGALESKRCVFMDSVKSWGDEHDKRMNVFIA